MKTVLFAAFFVFFARAGYSQCSATTYGSYICVNTANGFTAATTRNQTLSVTAGNVVVLSAQNLTGSGTIAVTGSGSCSGTINSYGSVTLAAAVATVVSTVASSTGTCTLTITTSVSSTITAAVWQWSGGNGAFDTAGNIASTGSVSSGVTTSCPAVTTTVNGDLVLCLAMDSGNNGGTYTAHNSFTFVTKGQSHGLFENNQVTAGAITPQFSYNNTATFSAATVTLKSGANSPTFSLGGGTFTTSLPRVNTVATTTGAAYLCVTSCSTNGCTPSAPAASSPGTCSAGTQYSVASQALNLPTGYITYSALATESGLNNSPVVTSPQYNSIPTLSSVNGSTVAYGYGNSQTVNGVYVNPYAGYVGTMNTMPTNFTATPAQNFIDFNGGTNGNAPALADMNTSTHGPAGTWGFTQAAARLLYTNALSLPSLPRPIVLSSTVYSQTGSLGIICTTVNGSDAATNCGHLNFTFANGSASASEAFWYQTNCDAGTVDCGANGALSSGGGDYTNMHSNPIGSNPPCAANFSGLLFENHGGNGGCLPYTNGLTYRVNMQENSGEAARTVTFSNGSAVISGTNTLAAGQAVRLTTTGTLPTNFALLTTYFVVSTGLSGSQFELAAVQGGTPIVAGSAGSGTHTATVQNVLTVCSSTGAFIGSVVAPAFTTASTPNIAQIGITGEGPSVSGYNIYYYGAVIDVTGKIALDRCVL